MDGAVTVLCVCLSVCVLHVSCVYTAIYSCVCIINVHISLVVHTSTCLQLTVTCTYSAGLYAGFLCHKTKLVHIVLCCLF